MDSDNPREPTPADAAASPASAGQGPRGPRRKALMLFGAAIGVIALAIAWHGLESSFH